MLCLSINLVSAVADYNETFGLSTPKLSDISTITPFNKLIGFWNFDGDDESTAYDFSLSNFLGTYTGNPLSLAGFIGRSLNLDGDDYIKITDDINFEDVTICSWIKPDSLDVKSFVWDTSGNAFSMSVDDNGDLVFNVFNEPGSYNTINIRVSQDDTSSIAVDTWTHVCFSYDSELGNMSYYEDSILRKSVQISDEGYDTDDRDAFNITAQNINHLQGVDTDGVDKVWWSFTTKLMISNMTDNTEILNITTDTHEGDIAVCDDKLFVPWTDGSFIEGAYTTMRVYNATNLTLIEEVNITEYINFGAGGVACDGENIYVVESCGAATSNKYQDNYVYVFNQSNVSQYIEKHKVLVPGDHIWYCTQTITEHNGDFLLGGYDYDYELIRLNSTFDFVENYGHSSYVSTGIASWNSTHIIAAYGTGTPCDGFGGYYSLESGYRKLTDVTTMTIGSESDGARPFNGSIDEVMLFKKALNSSEISDIYNNVSKTFSAVSYVSNGFLNITEGITYVNLSLNNYSFSAGSDVSVSLGKCALEDGYKEQYNQTKGYFYSDGSVGNYVDVIDNSRLDVGTGNLSIFAWVKTEKTGTQMIVNKEGVDPRYYFRIGSTGALEFVIDDGVTSISGVRSGTIIPLNEWHHVGVVADMDGNATYYYDGIANGVAYDLSVLNSMDNNNDFRIGQRFSNDYPFNGSIDEVMVFKKALSASEVSEIYNLSRYEDVYMDRDLAAWWRFENNTDDSFSINDGTLVGTASIETEVNNILKAHWSADDHANDTLGVNNGTLVGGVSYGTGKYGSAFVFDGVDGRVEFADDDSLDVGIEDFSFSVWINSDSATTGMILNKEGPDPRWYLRLLSGKLSVALDDGTNTAFDICNDGTENLIGTGWRNVIVNADRDGLLSCYVDSVLYGTPEDISAIGNLSNANDLEIGRRYSGEYYFNGSIDDAMIFNNLLTEQDREDLYLSGLLKFNQTDYYNISSGSSGYIEIEDDVDYILPTFKIIPDSVRFLSPIIYDSITAFFSSDLTIYYNLSMLYGVGTTSNASQLDQYNIFVNTSINSTFNISTFNNFDNSIISWWRMDDVNQSGEGALVQDYFGRNNGTAIGNASQSSSGKLGKAYTFDNDGDYINASALSASNWTASLWVKANVDNSGETEALLASWDGTNRIGIEVVTPNRISVFVNNSYYGYFNNLNWDDLSWHNIAYTWNGENLVLFFDGIKYTTHVVANPSDLTIQGTRIGADGRSSPRFLDGYVDDVIVFNRTLSDYEVQNLFINVSSKYFNVNYTNLDYGNYTFQSYAQDTLSNINFTEQYRVVLASGVAPNITIAFPDGSDINTYSFDAKINLDKTGICNYTIDSGANLSLGTAVSFVKSLTLADGGHKLTVFCTDIFGNGPSNDTIDFLVRAYTSPDGGSSTPDDGDGTISNDTVSLYDIEVKNDNWYFKINNIIEVSVFDIDKNPIDPERITIEIIDDSELDYSRNLIRKDIGEYNGIFNIKETNVTNILVNITVSEKFKTVSQISNITMSTETGFDKFGETTNEKLKSFRMWLDDNWKLALGFGFLIVAIFLVVAIYNFKK